MRRVLVAIGLMAMLAGCGMTLPGRGGGTGGGAAAPDAPVAGAIAGDAIETTPLDAAPPPPAITATPRAVATPEPAPEAVAEATAPAPAANAWPVAMDGAAQACTRSGGRFAAQGGGGAFACVRTPRDAGDSCRTGADCEGACLARSMTCAPVVPLFGCHEVVTASALRVTECLQ